MPTRGMSAKKLATILTGALMILGAVGGTGYKLGVGTNGDEMPTATEKRIGATEEGLKTLAARHEADMAGVRGDLQRLVAETAASGAKLTLLVDMVRDHTRKDKEQ